MSVRPVLIAAGRGSRLDPHTREVPKTLVPVLGRPMMEWILEALRAAGFAKQDVVCICGYRHEVLRARYPEFTFVHNTQWEHNNVLLSLMHARAHLSGGFVASYADIVYRRDTITQLQTSTADCSIVCDTAWRERYQGRTHHPESDAEKVSVEGRQVRHLSRRIPPEDAQAEFIGVMQATAVGARALLEHYDRVQRQHQGKVWREGRSFERAYLLDLLQDAVEHGFEIDATLMRGGYMEIDTVQDLGLAERWWTELGE